MKGILLRAVNSNNPIQMIYQSNEGTISQRIIKVLAVNNGQIKTYCYTRKQFRTFSLDNILSVAPLRQRRGA